MDLQTEMSDGTKTLGLETPVNGLDISADSSFHPYLPPGSFLDKKESSSSSVKPDMPFSDSHRDGVMSALQSLQEKMRRLEVERRAAESSLQTLASETQLYKSSLHQPLFLHHPHLHQPATPPREEEEEEEQEEEEEEQKEEGESAHAELSNGHPQQKHLESQLSTAETRCLLLEKQLDYMRQMVHTTERQRAKAMQKAEVLQQQQQQQQERQQQQQQQQQYARDTPSPISHDYHGQLDRIGELERDHLRLTASQSLAESRIKELEARLREERQHQTVLQDKTADRRERSSVSPRAATHSGADHPPPLPPPPPPPSGGPKKKRGGSSSSSISSSKKKKKKAVARKSAPARTEPNKHYRLNLADIPFVAGKSTAPSHAVGANIQKVLSLMKSHNLALCSTPLPNGHAHTHGHGGCNGETVGRLRSSAPQPRSPLPMELDLADLLAQLQDEFGQLSLEHQEYLQALQETSDPHLLQDLQKELDTLMVRMEVKGQQIAKVKQHQQRLEDARRAAKRGTKKSEPVPRPASAQGRLQTNHKVPHPNVSGNIRPKPSARTERDVKYKEVASPSLNVLRDMRKLQTTLRRDDLCWE